MTRCIDDRREQWPLLRLLPRASTGAVQCDGAIAIYKVFQVGLAPAAQLDRSPWVALSFVLASSTAVQCACTIKQPCTVCRKSFMFHLDRVDTCIVCTCGAIMPAIDQKCFDCKQTTSHGLLLRVYASQ